MSNIQHFTAENFDAEVLKSDTPVLVDFWAEWCVPCIQIAPIVEEIATEYAGKVKVGKYDVDPAPELASKFGIVSIPTLLLFKNGKVVDKRIGALPKKELVKLLDSNL